MLFGQLALLARDSTTVEFVTTSAPPVSTGNSPELEKLPIIEKKKKASSSMYQEDLRDQERTADIELLNLDKGYGGVSDSPDHGTRRDGF